MSTLAPIEISHKGYSGSTKLFLDRLEIGQSRIAESRLQANAVFIQATRVYGWRMCRKPLGDGRYQMTRIDEGTYDDRKLSRLILKELTARPWQSVPDLTLRLKLKYDSAYCAINRLFVQRKLKRAYVTNPVHPNRKLYVYSI